MNIYKASARKYAAKLQQFKISLRKGKDDKYIEFLKDCPNKTEFIRQAIDSCIAYKKR